MHGYSKFFADFALAEHIYAETPDETGQKCTEWSGSILFRKYVTLKSSDMVSVYCANAELISP
jgi:hypothetical protein